MFSNLLFFIAKKILQKYMIYIISFIVIISMMSGYIGFVIGKYY